MAIGVFFSIMVKSKCHRMVKQKKSKTEVKDICKDVIIMIDCGIYLSCYAKTVLING